jgi:hypothetical protein
MAGYSSASLQKKLGIKPGMSWVAPNAPDGFGADFEDGREVTLKQKPELVIAFFEWRRDAEKLWPKLVETVGPLGVIWVGWPKKASKVPTDITEDVWRDMILPTGWVDVKVCAIDDIWSGLKFVLRKELRP